MTESAQESLSIEEIESKLGIVFPAGYTQMLQDLENSDNGWLKEYRLKDFNGYTEWSIRFIRPNSSYMRSIEMVNELVPEPYTIIPFAWSVSSGNWLVFDYRKADAAPPIMYIDHEIAVVKEDAEECAREVNKTAEEVLEENLTALCGSFEILRGALQLQED